MSFVFGVITFVAFLLCLGVLLGIMYLGATFLYCIPYLMYLGVHIQKNNLPKDFRKYRSPGEEFKRASQFYSDLLHHRKPTFD